MFQYNSQGCTKPLISVGETVGSIRRQLICIGESKLYCLNKKICRLFSADKKENSLAHSRKIIGRKFEKNRQRQTTQTHTTHTNAHTHTHTHTQNHKNTNPTPKTPIFWQLIFIQVLSRSIQIFSSLSI